MQQWVISDTHFGHAAFVDGKFRTATGEIPRPFATVEDMDEAMLTNWNERVKPGDHVYHLGDVTMKVPFLRKYGPLLHGRKRLIRGNHDIFKTREYIHAGFEEVRGVWVHNKLVFTHIPIHPGCMARFHCNVHGHTHDAPSYGLEYLNVCVEKTDYRPMAMEDVEFWAKLQYAKRMELRGDQ